MCPEPGRLTGRVTSEGSREGLGALAPSPACAGLWAEGRTESPLLPEDRSGLETARGGPSPAPLAPPPALPDRQRGRRGGRRGPGPGGEGQRRIRVAIAWGAFRMAAGIPSTRSRSRLPASASCSCGPASTPCLGTRPSFDSPRARLGSLVREPASLRVPGRAHARPAPASPPGQARPAVSLGGTPGVVARRPGCGTVRPGCASPGQAQAVPSASVTVQGREGAEAIIRIPYQTPT